MEIWELLKRLQRQPTAEGVLSGNKTQIQNVNPTPADIVNLLKGSGAGLAGMPDLASMAMRPFGYGVPLEQTVGSSEWIGQQMGADPNSRAFMAGTFASPDPVDALRATQHLDDVLQAMTLWHASPYQFDEFDTSKTGQAYRGLQGHGIYTSEDFADASRYRRNRNSPENEEGYIYEVDVPDEIIDTMMRDNARLNREPDFVREAFRNLGIEDEGQAVSTAYRQLEQKVGSPGRASELLKEQGVAGSILQTNHRRYVPKPNHYMFFDPKVPKIISRNGKPIK
jgi:hypothetical protein